MTCQESFASSSIVCTEKGRCPLQHTYVHLNARVKTVSTRMLYARVCTDRRNLRSRIFFVNRHRNARVILRYRTTKSTRPKYAENRFYCISLPRLSKLKYVTCNIIMHSIYVDLNLKENSRIISKLWS